MSLIFLQDHGTGIVVWVVYPGASEAGLIVACIGPYIFVA